MSKSAIVRARVEPRLKSEVEDILECLGLTTSETIQLFDVRIPNEVTARTLKASRAGKDVKRFSSKQELYDDLGV